MTNFFRGLPVLENESFEVVSILSGGLQGWRDEGICGAEVLKLQKGTTRPLISGCILPYQPGGDAELGQLLRVHLVLGLLPDLLGQVADLCVVQSLHFDPPFEIILPEYK